MGRAGGFIVGGAVGAVDSGWTTFVSAVLHGNRLSVTDAYDLFTNTTAWAYGGCQMADNF